MFPLLKLLVTLALSKRGRRVLSSLFVYLNSDDGRKLLRQAQRVATGPEARRAATQVARVVTLAAGQARGGGRRAAQQQASQIRSRLTTAAVSARRAAGQRVRPRR